MRGERIIVQVLTKSGFSKKVVDGPRKGRRQAVVSLIVPLVKRRGGEDDPGGSSIRHGQLRGSSLSLRERAGVRGYRFLR
jgi:hypothetical protein